MQHDSAPDRLPRHGTGTLRQVAVGLLCLLALVLSAGQARAQDVMGMDDMGEKAQVSTKWLHDTAQPNGQNVLAVVFDVVPHWHIASDEAQAVKSNFNPSFTFVTVTSDDARVTFGPAQYPKAVLMPLGGLPDPIAVFDGRVVVYVPIVVAGDAEPGEVTVQVKAGYQACDDKTCDFPQVVKKTATFKVAAAGEAASVPATGGLFDKFDPAAFGALMQGEAPAGAEPVPQAVAPAEAEIVDFYFFKVDPSNGLGFAVFLLAAAVGGALLNFTPCVLPVIPIKILGLAKTAGNRTKTLALGTTMALGVLAFWLGLGVAIAGVSGFAASNQLFQYPWFSITVGIIIAVMAVGMCGLFAVRLPNFVYSVSPKHDSYTGSFGFGIMTAVLSTPCTAPMMGTAAAWAATKTPGVTLVTFAAIGLGMALPYFILSANPKLVDALPRTGPGSELLKQVMGLLMLAAAAFFVGAGISGMMSDGTEAAPKGHWWVVAGFVAAAGVWLIARLPRATKSPVKRGVFAALGVVTIAAAGLGAVAMTEKGNNHDAPINWVYYTPERFEQALADGHVVLLDFTADWCANCHLLEHTVLNTDAVTEMLDGQDYVAMKVDLTGGYPDGQLKLKETGSVTIPWLVIFAPDGREVFKANWYTATQITDALTQAKQSALANAN
jgi:thiol:disulfide interchange protein DsbD